MYLQHPQNKSRTASIIFYALCVLYVLSTVNAVLDSVPVITELVSNNPICKNIIFKNSVVEKNYDERQLIGVESFTLHIGIAGTTASGVCDFLAQCVLVRILNHYT
jgi:hypothetical protein